jgi:hypothetical protein
MSSTIPRVAESSDGRSGPAAPLASAASIACRSQRFNRGVNSTGGGSLPRSTSWPTMARLIIR